MNEHPTAMLAAYFDNELTNGEMHVVTRHVAGCAVCREELASFRALRQALVRADSVPEGDAAAFWRQLQPQLPPRRPHLGVGWIWGLFMVLGAALSQATLLGMFLAGLASRLGYSLLEPLNPVGSGWLGGLSNPVETALTLVVDSTLAGLLLDSPIAPFLPMLLIIALTAGITLSFLGWGFAALQHSRPAAV